ncbi:MAG: hypothetical protein V3U76_18365 [Granulosicoccus sp.]
MNTKSIFCLFALLSTLAASTAHAATLNELTAHRAAAIRINESESSWQPAYKQRFMAGNNVSSAGPRQRRDATPPWILGSDDGNPPDRVFPWAYGQARAGDDPYSWQYLDSNHFRIRWGNPLAPWASAELQHWWRARAGMDSYFQSTW